MVELELDEEMSLVVSTMTATAFFPVNDMPLFPPSFYFGSMLFINNHSTPPTSRSLLFQHTKIEVDHPSSRLKTSGTFMQRRFPLTPLDAGSDVSRSFLE